MGLFDIGSKDLVLILLIVVLLWGGNKVPELMRGLGQGIREFRHASEGHTSEGDKAASLDEPAAKHSDLS
jgi:sec-independent protein translocase protein TatA